MDNQSLELIISRIERLETSMDAKFDRMESKVDVLNEHRWTWIGKMSVFTFLGSIVFSYILNKFSK